MKQLYWAFIFLGISLSAVPKATRPVYICTAADEHYFHCLRNLIGSLHKHNFNDIAHIAVFDLGLKQEQKEQLATIAKVDIYDIEKTHPDLLTRFNTRLWGKPVPGWYAWKAVILKQAFDLFGQDAIILWIDAGTTVLNDISALFSYIEEHGYFFHNGSPWALNRETTQFVKNAFNLASPERSWLLQDTVQGLEAGFMGVTKKVYDDYVYPMYELTQDLRYFADDGTCPGGFGNSRHDLSLFSIHALLNNYKIYHHFKCPQELFYLNIRGMLIPFHIACIPEARIPQTNIYCARFDVNPDIYIPYIQYEHTTDREFVIIIPSYNNEQWYYNNLGSVLMQKYSNYRVIYIDDASSDNTLQCVKEFITKYDASKKITLINNPDRRGAMANFYYAIHSCKPHEIIVMLDGDDWFSNENVLAYLNAAYQDPNVWITYGQFQEYPNGRIGGARQLPSEIIAHRAYREYDWVTTHLRTFYAFLFHKINKEDFLYEGNFFPMAWDLAIMFPILEMAGERSKFISDVLYIYNRATPINDNKVNMQLQMCLDRLIHEKMKYNPLLF